MTVGLADYGGPFPQDAKHERGAGVIKDYGWWNRNAVLALVVAFSIVPLLWPPFAPLIDLPGHMGRYAVELDPTAYTSWYTLHWQLIGNLGVDGLVQPLGRLIGLEPAVKLVVIAIPPLTVAGFLWIAHEVHGHVPPTAAFAAPLAYGHPFIFGFVNYALAAALAMLAFALWLRLGRLGAFRVRGLLFALVATIVWLAHTFAWGVLGLLCFASETVRLRDSGRGWIESAIRAAGACTPMALPIIPMFLWRSDAAHSIGIAYRWRAKLVWIMMTLRDHWAIFDQLSIIALGGVVLIAWRSPKFLMARNLVACAGLLAITFLLLPWLVFDSAYADMRLTPLVFAMALLAIRPAPHVSPKLVAAIAFVAVGFYGTRLAATTASFALISSRQQSALHALDAMPDGARVVAFTRTSCRSDWSSKRLEHVPSFVIVRRHGFANNQWQVSGAQPMRVVYAAAGAFAFDPSQLVVASNCADHHFPMLDESLARVPRQAFDYVWLVDPPAFDARLLAGTTLTWSNGTDRLYRIER